MIESFDKPMIGDFVRIRRVALKDTPPSFITLMIVDITKSETDSNISFYSGVKYPFIMDGVMYSFFTDNITKNFGKIQVDELIKTYPEYLL